jgi:hypothetical protein
MFPVLFLTERERRGVYRLAKTAAPPIRAPMAMPAVGMAPAPSEELLDAVPEAVPEAESEPSVESAVSVADEESSVAVPEAAAEPEPDVWVTVVRTRLVTVLSTVVTAVLVAAPEAVSVARLEATSERIESWMLPMRSLSLLKALLAASWADEAAATAEESTMGVVTAA